jgi:hypothetical protein
LWRSSNVAYTAADEHLLFHDDYSMMILLMMTMIVLTISRISSSNCPRIVAAVASVSAVNVAALVADVAAAVVGVVVVFDLHVGRNKRVTVTWTNGEGELPRVRLKMNDRLKNNNPVRLHNELTTHSMLLSSSSLGCCCCCCCWSLLFHDRALLLLNERAKDVVAADALGVDVMHSEEANVEVMVRGE